MTREYYFATFFKLWATPDDKKLLLIERPHSAIEFLENEEEYQQRVLSFIDFETPEKHRIANYDTLHVYEGQYAFRMDSSMQFSPGYEASFRDLTNNYYAWIRASAWVYAPGEEQMQTMRLVVHFDHKGGIYKYRSARLSDERFDAEAGRWSKIHFDYLTPEVVSKKDRLKVYLWYEGNDPVYVDNLKVEIFYK
jgi:hypothetical protein